ncbi:MAG: hypothetical protein DWQ01_01220 [Planctomycetota bacterium]|nr:MAG: hypothetical protein DWQ01_01220 [Planctomycetota bacterium]
MSHSISRDAFRIYCEGNQVLLVSLCDGLRMHGKLVEKGYQQCLIEGDNFPISVGKKSSPLKFDLRVMETHPPDILGSMEKPKEVTCDYGGLSPKLPPQRLRGLCIRRINNLEKVSYGLIFRDATFGKGGRDLFQVSGLPAGGLRLVKLDGRLYFGLQPNLEEEESQLFRGILRPVVGRIVLKLRNNWKIALECESDEASASEADLIDC